LTFKPSHDASASDAIAIVNSLIMMFSLVE
jgi:hypothetical protein